MQNRTHVKWLLKQIGMEDPIYNIIVFSERCELKKVTVTSNDINIIKRNQLPALVRKLEKNKGEVLPGERIKHVYDFLYPFTKVSSAIKESHVRNIEEKYKV